MPLSSGKPAEDGIGKGSRVNALFHASFTARQRAEKMNEGELRKYERLGKYLDDVSSSEANMRDRITARMRQSRVEMNIYRRLVHHEYKVENLRTLQFGYDAKRPKSPEGYRRGKIEARIYHSGFNVGTLRPEIQRVLGSWEHQARQKLHLQRHLNKSNHISSRAIDRNMSTSSVIRAFNKASCCTNNQEALDETTTPASNATIFPKI